MRAGHVYPGSGLPGLLSKDEELVQGIVPQIAHRRRDNRVGRRHGVPDHRDRVLTNIVMGTM